MTTPPITLTIRKGGSAEAGWTNVKASDNTTTYGFSFSGGDDTVGGLRTTKGKGNDTAALSLSLTGGGGYQIDHCSFEGDDDNQMSWTPTAGSTTSGTITDLNNKSGLVDYTIHVKDTNNNNCIIKCDPQIRNQPP